MWLTIETIAYHFDPVASWSFDPPLIYLDTIVSKRVLEVEWNIGVMSIDGLIVRGFTLERGHQLDTIERRRSAVDAFSDRKWRYYPFGPPEWHEYPTPPAPPSQPPNITQFSVLPVFTSIVCEYTAEDDVGLRTVSCEVLTQNYELVERKLDLAVPTAAFVFDNLTAGRDYNVKLYVVDTSENVATREEYDSIVDFTPPTIHLFTTTSHVAGQITLDVNVTDNSGGDIFCSASLYWIFDLDNELDYYYVELVDGVGSVTFFANLDPERTYIVELLVRDNAWNTRIERREGYPNGQGVVVGSPEHWW
jgi:hypothetical protein